MEEKKIDARKGGVTDTTFQTFIKIPQSLKHIVSLFSVQLLWGPWREALEHGVQGALESTESGRS